VSGGVVYGLYALDDPTKRVRYVGITTQGGSRRLAQHKGDAMRGSQYPVHRWISRSECHVSFTVLEVVADTARLGAREVWWVRKIGYANLLNVHTPFDGTPNLAPSPETRGKISESLRKFYRENVNPNLGRKMSCEQRAKLSALAMGRTPWNKGKVVPVSDVERIRLQERAVKLWTGEKAHYAKLTESDVREIRIRAANGERNIDIAEDYPVNNRSIGHIVRRVAWNHVRP